MIAKLITSLLLASTLLSSPAFSAPPIDSETVGTVLANSDSLESVEAIPADIDLWQRMRQGMRMAELDSQKVAVQEDWFLARPAYLQIAFKRARLYLHHIVDEVEARGLPSELALLPVVESAFNPRALSPANAAGIWQFIPSTGKVFGLKQNGWYDGRQDVVTATDAALDYLEKLHGMFGNWELALAAYNCGEGCVGRAIARNRANGLPTDYLSLDLPGETRNYVPRLLAVRNLVREPERHGLILIDMPNRPYFEQVRLPYPMEAKTVARLAEMEIEELQALNPGFRRKVIHAESQDTLLIPLDRLAAFRTRFEAQESQRMRLRSYTASKGELLSRIADKFDVTVQWLKEHNPMEVKRGKIVQAQTLLLPPSSVKVVAQRKPVDQAVTSSRTSKPAARTQARVHTVRRGDTLFSLAKRYQVTIADIRDFNGALKTLRPGAKLQIPRSS